MNILKNFLFVVFIHLFILFFLHRSNYMPPPHKKIKLNHIVEDISFDKKPITPLIQINKPIITKQIEKPQQKEKKKTAIFKKINTIYNEIKSNDGAFKPSAIFIPPKMFIQSSDVNDAEKEKIINHIKNIITLLPEQGEVKLVLKISEKGFIDFLEILNFENANNAEYLKKKLLTLTFPWFNDAYSKKSITLTLLFKNED